MMVVRQTHGSLGNGMLNAMCIDLGTSFRDLMDRELIIIWLNFMAPVTQAKSRFNSANTSWGEI